MICSNFPPHTGGLEVMVQRLASGVAHHHRVTVVAAAWEGAPRLEKVDGMEIHRLATIHWSEQWGVPYPVPTGPGLVSALSAIASADVFHAHGALYPSTVIAAVAAQRARRPLVLTEHVGFVSYRQAGLNILQAGAWNSIGNAVLRR